MRGWLIIIARIGGWKGYRSTTLPGPITFIRRLEGFDTLLDCNRLVRDLLSDRSVAVLGNTREGSPPQITTTLSLLAYRSEVLNLIIIEFINPVIKLILSGFYKHLTNLLIIFAKISFCDTGLAKTQRY